MFSGNRLNTFCLVTHHVGNSIQTFRQNMKVENVPCWTPPPPPKVANSTLFFDFFLTLPFIFPLFFMLISRFFLFQKIRRELRAQERQVARSRDQKSSSIPSWGTHSRVIIIIIITISCVSDQQKQQEWRDISWQPGLGRGGGWYLCCWNQADGSTAGSNRRR